MKPRTRACSRLRPQAVKASQVADEAISRPRRAMLSCTLRLEDEKGAEAQATRARGSRRREPLIEALQVKMKRERTCMI